MGVSIRHVVAQAASKTGCPASPVSEQTAKRITNAMQTPDQRPDQDFSRQRKQEE
jgi:hypothetical protein